MAGRPTAPVTIISIPFQVVQIGQLVESIGEITNSQLVRKVNNDPEDVFPCIQWLALFGLLANTVDCPTHQQPCRLNKAEDSIDKREWRCRAGHCNYKCSIRNGSFFARSHFPLPTLVDIIYWWSIDVPLHTLARECQLASPKTAVDWFNFLRDICLDYALDQQDEIGGLDNTGNPKIIEVDESKFMHRKYHRGQWREGNWVLRGVERGTGLCFFEIVERRDEGTILPLLYQHIRPNSNLVTDMWRAYINLINQPGYQHLTVNHSLNFVDPRAHTQTIECKFFQTIIFLQVRFLFFLTPNIIHLSFY